MSREYHDENAFSDWIREYHKQEIETRLRLKQELDRQISACIISIDDEYYWEKIDERVTFDTLIIKIN